MTQIISVHKKVKIYLENEEYEEITDLVKEHSRNRNLDELLPIFEVLNSTVKEMKTKNEAKTLYEPVFYPSINTLLEENMRDVAEFFFAPGKGVIAREIEQKEKLKMVC